MTHNLLEKFEVELRRTYGDDIRRLDGKPVYLKVAKTMYIVTPSFNPRTGEVGFMHEEWDGKRHDAFVF